VWENQVPAVIAPESFQTHEDHPVTFYFSAFVKKRMPETPVFSMDVYGKNNFGGG
jgi:hypothetical protein